MKTLCHPKVTLSMFVDDVTYRISVFLCKVSAQVVSICVHNASEKPLISVWPRVWVEV